MWTLNHEFDKKLQHVCMYPPEYLSGHDKTWSLSLDLYITSQQTNVLVFKCLSEISEFLIRQRFDRRRVDGPIHKYTRQHKHIFGIDAERRIYCCEMLNLVPAKCWENL